MKPYKHNIGSFQALCRMPWNDTNHIRQAKDQCVAYLKKINRWISNAQHIDKWGYFFTLFI